MESPQNVERALELYQSGQLDDAIQCLRNLTEKEPANALAWDYLGFFLRANGDLSAALDAGGKATSIQPPSPQAWNNLGNTYAALENDNGAMKSYQRALELASTYADAWANKGLTEKRVGKTNDAIASFVRAASLLGDNPAAQNTIGNQLFELNAYTDAASCYVQAVNQDPLFANAFNNLGNTRLKLLELEPAISAYRSALAIEPDHHDALNGYAQTLLLSGDYDGGWRAYEARRNIEGQKIATPSWTGTGLTGKTLWLYSEQGAGDTIQFLRFVAHLKNTAHKVILSCPASLVTLAAQVDGVDEAVSLGVLPDADLSAPLMSLPFLLGLTEISDVAISTPYLTSPTPSEPKTANNAVGLVWAGNTDHINDINRSLDLADLAPLMSQTAFDFYSLQLGPAKDQLVQLDPKDRITDLTDAISSYADTANVIDGLDLIITVDTSVAHLAGAMGKPCWVLLPYVPDWRWQLSRDGTVWYPSVRLFRQPVRGDWRSVVQSVIEALNTYK